MTSSPTNHDDDSFFALDPKSEAVAHFVSLVGSKLQEAFRERKAKEHLTFQAVADALGSDRSRIHRCLSGHSNLTLETVAELVWALEGEPLFDIVLDQMNDRECNNFTRVNTRTENTPAAVYSPVPATGSPHTKITNTRQSTYELVDA